MIILEEGLNISKIQMDYTKIMNNARRKILGTLDNSINDSQAIGIMRILRMEKENKNEAVLSKLVELLNVSSIVNCS